MMESVQLRGAWAAHYKTLSPAHTHKNIWELVYYRRGHFSRFQNNFRNSVSYQEVYVAGYYEQSVTATYISQCLPTIITFIYFIRGAL